MPHRPRPASEPRSGFPQSFHWLLQWCTRSGPQSARDRIHMSHRSRGRPVCPFFVALLPMPSGARGSTLNTRYFWFGCYAHRMSRPSRAPRPTLQDRWEDAQPAGRSPGRWEEKKPAPFRSAVEVMPGLFQVRTRAPRPTHLDDESRSSIPGRRFGARILRPSKTRRSPSVSSTRPHALSPGSRRRSAELQGYLSAKTAYTSLKRPTSSPGPCESLINPLLAKSASPTCGRNDPGAAKSM